MREASVIPAGAETRARTRCERQHSAVMHGHRGPFVRRVQRDHTQRAVTQRERGRRAGAVERHTYDVCAKRVGNRVSS